MTDEIRPGFASESEEDADPKPLTGNLEVAHYGGSSVAAAAEIWKRETLCVSCLMAPMCRVSDHTQEPLIVVARCLAYLPAGG